MLTIFQWKCFSCFYRNLKIIVESNKLLALLHEHCSSIYSFNHVDILLPLDYSRYERTVKSKQQQSVRKQEICAPVLEQRVEKI